MPESNLGSADSPAGEKAPGTSELPTTAPSELVPIGRKPSRVGTAIIAFALIVYIPMSIAPLVEIFVKSGDTPPRFLLLASLFNSLVFVVLILVGRWLRRTIGPTIYGPRPQLPMDQDASPRT